MSRHKTVLSFNELSSASCDLVDVIESVDNSDCLNVVSNFVSSLYPSNYPKGYNEGFAEVEIDSDKLQSCVDQLQAFFESLDKDILDEPKDDQDSDFTIGDCLEEVLSFLKSLSSSEEIIK